MGQERNEDKTNAAGKNAGKFSFAEDEMRCEYREGRNILTITRNIQKNQRI